MQKDHTQDNALRALRERAEAMLAALPPAAGKEFSAESVRLLHELETQQIELELQNEELRDAQQRLREAHRSYIDLYDFAPVGYLTIESSGTIVKANLTAGSLLNVGRREIEGRPFTDFVLPEDQDIHYQQRRTFDKTAEARTYDVRMRRQPDEVFWARVTIAERNAEAGLENSLRVALSDVTDLRQAQTRADQLQAQVSRADRISALTLLAGGVAHDLNNALGPQVALPAMISSLVHELVTEPSEKRENIDECLTVIETSARRSAEVVKDLSLLTDQRDPQLTPVDISTIPCVVENFITTNKLGTAPGITFTHSRPDEPLLVHGNASHLTRACSNLMRNAADAIDGEGEVSTRTFAAHIEATIEGFEAIPPGHYAAVEIRDTGRGISAADQEHIFDPFFTRKPLGKCLGSGLGLSVVHGVVKEHKGFIDLNSGPGKGTAFTIYIPLLSPADAAPAELVAAPVAGGTERILIVDDEPAQCFVARRALKKLGYTTIEAGNGHEAVAMFEKASRAGVQNPFDLVALDMIMEQGFDGLDTCKAILALYPDQKILIVSGHAADVQASQAIALGADWLAKPYEMTDLARAIRKRLDQD